MLAPSWYICAFLLRRLAVAPTPSAGMLMGALPLVLLICAEIATGNLLLGRSIGEHFALYRESSHALGPAAQIAFSRFPLLQMLRARSQR